MTKYEFKQQQKEEKKAKRERKKFEKKSNSKDRQWHSVLYKTMVRVIPIGSLVYFVLRSLEYITTTTRPQMTHIYFNIFEFKILDLYISAYYFPVVLIALLIPFLILVMFIFKYLVNGNRATKTASNIGKASKIYSPTMLKILSTMLFGWVYAIIALFIKISEMYNEVILDLLNISWWCFAIAGISGILGEFVYQRILKRIEKNTHEAKHITQMSTYDIARSIEE